MIPFQAVETFVVESSGSHSCAKNAQEWATHLFDEMYARAAFVWATRQAATLAIANSFNNDFPTASAWTTTASVGVGPVSFRISDTQSGTNISIGGSAKWGNLVNVTGTVNQKGDTSATIRYGGPFGIAYNPNNGQVGGYIGTKIGTGKASVSATLSTTIGKVGTNASCGRHP